MGFRTRTWPTRAHICTQEPGKGFRRLGSPPPAGRPRLLCGRHRYLLLAEKHSQRETDPRVEPAGGPRGWLLGRAEFGNKFRVTPRLVSAKAFVCLPPRSPRCPYMSCHPPENRGIAKAIEGVGIIIIIFQFKQFFGYGFNVRCDLSVRRTAW